MKVLRIKNLRAIFYSIMRQLESGMKISFCILRGKSIRYELRVGDTSDVYTDFEFVKIFSDLKRRIDAGGTVVVTIMDELSFKISKYSTNYYAIDNANIMLNYIIFNNIFNTDAVCIKIVNNKKLLQKININISNKIEEESRFFVEKMSKYIDKIEIISTKINNIVNNLDETQISILTEYNNIKFYVKKVWI